MIWNSIKKAMRPGQLSGSLAVALLLLCSCNKTSKENRESPDLSLTDKIISLVIETRTGESVELPELYTRAVNGIAPENDQTLFIADKLELRGFKKTASERRDQQLSGRRMFVLTMEKGDCRCDVSKVFYSTANVSQYFVSERIACQTIQP